MLMEYAVRAYADANGIPPSAIRGAVVAFTAPDPEHAELLHTFVVTPVESSPTERLRALQEAVAQVDEEIRAFDEQRN